MQIKSRLRAVVFLGLACLYSVLSASVASAQVVCSSLSITPSAFVVQAPNTEEHASLKTRLMNNCKYIFQQAYTDCVNGFDHYAGGCSKCKGGTPTCYAYTGEGNTPFEQVGAGMRVVSGKAKDGEVQWSERQSVAPCFIGDSPRNAPGINPDAIHLNFTLGSRAGGAEGPGAPPPGAGSGGKQNSGGGKGDGGDGQQIGGSSLGSGSGSGAPIGGSSRPPATPPGVTFDGQSLQFNVSLGTLFRGSKQYMAFKYPKIVCVCDEAESGRFEAPFITEQGTLSCHDKMPTRITRAEGGYGQGAAPGAPPSVGGGSGGGGPIKGGAQGGN